jgi:hypothetical protein
VGAAKAVGEVKRVGLRGFLGMFGGENQTSLGLTPFRLEPTARGLISLKRRAVIIWRRSYLQHYGDLCQLFRYRHPFFYAQKNDETIMLPLQPPLTPMNVREVLGAGATIMGPVSEKFYRYFGTICWFEKDGAELALCGHEHLIGPHTSEDRLACIKQKRAEDKVVLEGLVIEERSRLRSMLAQLVRRIKR